MFAVLGMGISALVGSGAEESIVNITTRQIQVFQGINLYPWIIVISVSILAIAGVFFSKVYLYVPRWLAVLRTIFTGTGAGLGKWTGNGELDKAIENAGYSYDVKQDIFYSNMDAWQRKMGYCRLYDEAAASLDMIVDCEPIYFEYEGKKWLIEFWKGQLI